MNNKERAEEVVSRMVYRLGIAMTLKQQQMAEATLWAEFDEVREEVIDAATEQILNDWKPIDTAPKDGRTILLGWLPNGRLEFAVRSRWKMNEWEGHYTPTHWRPIQSEKPHP